MIRFGHEVDQISKEHKNIYNRLKSIEEDSQFIDQVAALYPELPLVANERCGSWYINRNKHKQYYSAYFKSTDGHTGVWDFNVRRGNFHLFDIISKNGGCMVIDSTRRGKRIPDALSKTIPIWCCTINRAILNYRRQQQQQQSSENHWDDRFHSLPSAVFRSEHDQIESRIDGFVKKLQDLGANIERISNILKKPLRPIWLTPQSNLDNKIDIESCDFYPIILLSASKCIENGGIVQRGSYLYVQGSADDHEAWSLGLTNELFWKHHHTILDINNSAFDCEEIVKEVVDDYQYQRSIGDNNNNNDDGNQHQQLTKATMIQGTQLFIGTFDNRNDFEYIIECLSNKSQAIDDSDDDYSDDDEENDGDNDDKDESDDDHNNENKKKLLLYIHEGKKGQHELEKCIPLAIDFAKNILSKDQPLLVCSMDGKNRSVGIALAIFVHFYNDQNEFQLYGTQNLTKDKIKKKLVQLIESYPKAAPSRVTLRRVNTHFLSDIK